MVQTNQNSIMITYADEEKKIYIYLYTYINSFEFNYRDHTRKFIINTTIVIKMYYADECQFLLIMWCCESFRDGFLICGRGCWFFFCVCSNSLRRLVISYFFSSHHTPRIRKLCCHEFKPSFLNWMLLLLSIVWHYNTYSFEHSVVLISGLFRVHFIS